MSLGKNRTWVRGDSDCRQLLLEVLFQGAKKIMYVNLRVFFFFFFSGRRKKYCLYANGKEAAEGKEEFIQQEKEAIMA